MSEEQVDLKALEKLLEEFKDRKYPVIPILQKAQSLYGYLPKQVMFAISEKTGIPLSQLMGVATFYAQFRLTRQGRNLIRICDGTACHVRGRPRASKPSRRLCTSRLAGPPRITGIRWKLSTVLAHADWRPSRSSMKRFTARSNRQR